MICRYLVREHRCAVGVKDHRGHTPLMLARREGHQDVVEFIEGELRILEKRASRASRSRR
ncbi:hypothetical protein BC829DRAFT_402809 [Chytridium lagenaria]|nr:hypothetical protein BC829DRAFT_402809 [Chytridium lagenaria]